MRYEIVEQGNGIRIAVFELAAMGRRARHPQPIFEAAEQIQQRQQRVWFRSRGRNSWPALSPVTVADKRRQGFGSRMLVRKGLLYDSLQGGNMSIRHLNSERLEIGTSVPYAPYHQYGTSKMPRRRLTATDDQAREQLERMIARYVGGRNAE